MESRTFVLKHKLPIARVEKYWKGLEEGKVYGTVCKICGAKYYPPQVDCSKCFNSEVEWVEISGEGTIECFTQLHSFPQGFEFVGKPYTIAVAKFGDFKVMGWYEGEIPKVGEKVRIKTGKDETGVWKVYFEPVG
ncbi:Zn-ribbon domain-containing OB-fold protein [Ferroglobus sp.]|uniref:Zn-ribbon domain-containing OB-fold protein n=1 Tax=Ferroglobus sp. TaxID=2614230 RepID=UPI0025BF5E32|nr:Zn-ribbon domain-containing OB-fold protein [Ferroglobus sp.]